MNLVSIIFLGFHHNIHYIVCKIFYQSLACWIDTVEGYYKYAVERGDEREVVSVPLPSESCGS